MWVTAGVVAGVLLGSAHVPAAAASVREPVVEYELAADLDATAHRVQASGRLRWWNRSAEPVAQLLLDSSGLHVTALDAAGEDLLPALVPRRDSASGATTLVPLPAPVPPGSSVTLELEYTAPLSLLGREGVLLASYWFPRVLADLGDAPMARAQRWPGGRMSGELARFRVELTVPSGWEVAGTGVEVRRDPAPSSGRERVLLAADGVRDFAWCAAPRTAWVVAEEDFDPLRDVPRAWLLDAAEVLGSSPADLELAPVRLRVLAAAGDRVSMARMLAAARAGLAWVGLWHGPYPHPQLTLVVLPARPGDPDAFAHPMLVGVPRVSGLRATAPVRWPVVESLTVHQLAYQLLEGGGAPLDSERRLIDRGLATHAELSWTAAATGDRRGARRVDRLWTRERLALAVPSWPWRLDRRPGLWLPGDGGTGSGEVRSGLVVRTLEGLVGERSFARAVRRYVERGRAGPPVGTDLITIAAEIATVDLGAFVDEVVRAEHSADWAVERVAMTRREPGGGKADALSDGGWSIELDLARPGGVSGPVEVRLRWADGREERRQWRAVEPRERWRIESATPLAEIAIDPDGVWALETRRADNYWRAEPSGLARRVARWLTAGVHLVRLGDLPWG